MPDPTLWPLFLIASLLVLLTPGPAVLYIVARSIQHGRTTGIVSVVGIHAGTVVHIAAAAMGMIAPEREPASSRSPLVADGLLI